MMCSMKLKGLSAGVMGLGVASVTRPNGLSGFDSHMVY